MDTAGDTFSSVLQRIKNDCAWETMPETDIPLLAALCGPLEIKALIQSLDTLDNADLIDDAGDMADEYWRLRTALSRVLAAVGQPGVEPLLGALHSPNRATQEYAARALGQIGDTRAFGPLCLLLAHDADHNDWRPGVIGALGDLKDRRAIPVLLPYLNPAHDQVNRGWIIRITANALGNIGTDSVIGPLCDVIKMDHDWFARLGAVEGLAKMSERSNPRVTEALQIALSDSDGRVQAEAKRALQPKVRPTN